MWAVAAAVAALALASPPKDRVLACRPTLAGDPALARGEAVAEALRERSDRILDYGVPCESVGEAARAATRAGLAHAILTSAEGRTEGSLFELTVVSADERVVEVRRLAVAPGAVAAKQVAGGLDALVAELRRPQTRRLQRRAALGIAGGGLALIGAGLVAASIARDDAAAANAAVTPADYLGSRRAWERGRALSAVAFGLGGAALGAGLVWHFDLQRED